MEIIKSQSFNSSPPKITRNCDNNEDGIQIVLDVNDTILHSISTDINATKVKQIVDHKLVLILVTIQGMIMLPLWIINGESMYKGCHIGFLRNEFFGLDAVGHA
eukprot:241547_1